MSEVHGAENIASQHTVLSELPCGVRARVVAVRASHPACSPELSRRLAELGFLPGEEVRIVARGWLAREPLAVRVGTGTFALRKFEAACVHVQPDPEPEG